MNRTKEKKEGFDSDEISFDEDDMESEESTEVSLA